VLSQPLLSFIGLLECESCCKGSSVSAVRSPVVDEEMMRQVTGIPWLGLVLFVSLFALSLLVE